MTGLFKSGKRFGHELGLSCCFRQWKADSHCKYLHGYAFAISLEFEATELNDRNWVVDFGDMKALKEFIVWSFDHTTLVARDDPLLSFFNEMKNIGLIQLWLVEATGCEALAKLIFDVSEGWLVRKEYSPRVRMSKVTVAEHGANWASYEESRWP